MKLTDFDYDLPAELIASEPLADRSASRMLVLDRKAGRWQHRMFQEIPEFLSNRDILIFNESKVVKARLVGKRTDTGGTVEAFVLRPSLTPGFFECLVKLTAARKEGVEFRVGDGVVARIVGPTDDPMIWTVDFSQATVSMDAIMETWGRVPLPPYIRREPVGSDVERYQTIYAKHPGSVAAPTAGLHFTPQILERIRARGVCIDHVTLHVGLGTFLPIKTDDVEAHSMHRERFEISPDLVLACESARREDRRVVAVGTTSVRTLESAARGMKRTTDLFLRPGSDFHWVDAMVTNFHQPKSSLIVMLSAFVGRELLMDAYHDAIREKYRFFSYGDSMLVV